MESAVWIAKNLLSAADATAGLNRQSIYSWTYLASRPDNTLVFVDGLVPGEE
jgi:hypothetical protein